MAEIPPNIPNVPTGAVPPPKKETGKVQPKKETVRINLPPRPTAAPTIKLPTLPPGGPTGAPSPAPMASSAAVSPPAAYRTAEAPTVAASPAPAKGAAPAVAQKPAAMAQRPAAPIVPTIKTVDQILIFAAAVASLVAVGGVTWVFITLSKALASTS